MAGSPIVYTPPAYNVNNVLYGVGVMFTAPVGTAMPADYQLGVGSAWLGAGWTYVGSTDAGVTLTWSPSVTDIAIEEQPTPVAVLVDKGTIEIGTSLVEETLANINLAYGNAGTIAVTAAGAGQPGKSILSLSINFPQIACAVIGKNQQGFARVLEVPAVMSTAQVKTDYRRAASARMYPMTLTSVCQFSAIQWVDLTAVATS